MLTRTYLGLIVVSIAVMGFFTYYSWSWLQSIGLPAAAVDGYAYHAGFSWWLLWVSAVALLIVGNAILWVSHNSWALWTTLIYFAVFVLVRTFWLDQSLFQFKKAAGLWDGSFSLGPLLGVILVVPAAVAIFLDQYVVVRLHRKMYPPVVEEQPPLPAASSSESAETDRPD